MKGVRVIIHREDQEEAKMRASHGQVRYGSLHTSLDRFWAHGESVMTKSRSTSTYHSSSAMVAFNGFDCFFYDISIYLYSPSPSPSDPSFNVH